jgi:hypothetical protein
MRDPYYSHVRMTVACDPAFRRCNRPKATTTFVRSSSLSTSAWNRNSHQTVFREISYLKFVLKFVITYCFWLKSEDSKTFCVKTSVCLCSVTVIGLHICERLFFAGLSGGQKCLMGQTRVQDEENVFSDLPFYTGKNSCSRVHCFFHSVWEVL